MRRPPVSTRALDDLEAVALDQLVVAGDVIRMGVRRQQMRDLEALALDDLVQWLERCAAVDEDGLSARLVGEQVRIREPLRVHASLDQHARTVTHRKDRRPGGLLSHAEGIALVIHGPTRRPGIAGTVTSTPPGSAGGSGGCTTIGTLGSAGTPSSTGSSGNGGSRRPHHRHDRRLGNGRQSRDEGKRRSRVVFPQDRGRRDRGGRLRAAVGHRKLRNAAATAAGASVAEPLVAAPPTGFARVPRLAMAAVAAGDF